jgi:hypothetical protein
MIAAPMRLLVIGIPLLLFAAGVMFGYWRRRSVRVTDPSCGKCRYIVHGLESFICPECGSDLREVGILAPGTREPLSRGKRVLLWLFIAPAPTLFLFAILGPLLAPQWLQTTQRRVIFCQAPYCNVTLTANSEGKKLIFGQPPRSRAPAATEPGNFFFIPAEPEVLFLTSGTSPIFSMNIDLPTRTFRYFPPNQPMVKGTFDAAAIEKWLNLQGFNDPRVADRAADIYACVNEMGTPAGYGFTKFATEANRPTGIAHPTSTFTRPQPNELTAIAPFVLFALVFLAGLPFAWREKRSGTGAPPVQKEELVNTVEAPVPR